MSSNQKSSPAAEWKFWDSVWWRGEFGGSEWVPWSPEINKSDGWTSGATGSAGVSAGDPDGGAGGAGYARLGAWIRVGDDGRVKNCAAHDDTKSSVESEVTQSWRVFSPGGDESAGAGAGPPGVSTEGSTQEQGSQDTDLWMKQNTLHPRLFLAVWPFVNQWIREGLETEAVQRGSRSILRRCWLVWAQDIGYEVGLGGRLRAWHASKASSRRLRFAWSF